MSDVYLDEPTPPTTLYLAALKGDHANWAVAKATEVGVSRVVPLLTRRAVAKFSGDVSDKTLARWRRITREAQGQCRRTYDVAIEEPMTVNDVPEDVAVADLCRDPVTGAAFVPSRSAPRVAGTKGSGTRVVVAWVLDRRSCAPRPRA